MKHIFYLSIFLVANTLLAQGKAISPINDVQTAQESLATGGLWVSSNTNKEEIQGTPYLFDSWNTLSKLYTDEQIYSLQHFNYNIELERFEAKFSEDSILIMNTGNLKKIIINNIELTPYYDSEAQKVTFFQEVAKLNAVVLLKKYLVRIQEGSFNPMTQKQIKPDTYVKEEKFYLKTGNESDLKPIKLKKASILKLVDTQHQSKVKAYAKEHKLKYTKVNDVHKILQYYNTLTI